MKSSQTLPCPKLTTIEWRKRIFKEINGRRWGFRGFLKISKKIPKNKKSHPQKKWFLTSKKVIFNPQIFSQQNHFPHFWNIYVFPCLGNHNTSTILIVIYVITQIRLFWPILGQKIRHFIVYKNWHFLKSCQTLPCLKFTTME